MYVYAIFVHLSQSVGELILVVYELILSSDIDQSKDLILDRSIDR